MTILNDLSETMSMKGERPTMTKDQKKALPIIALALRGDKDALHYLGLYDPDGPITEPQDFEADVVEALKEFNRRYRSTPSGSPGTEALREAGE